MKIEDLKRTEKSSSKTIACPVSEQTHFIMNAVATKKGITVANILRLLVNEFLDENSDFINSIEINEEPRYLQAPQADSALPAGSC